MITFSIAIFAMALGTTSLFANEIAFTIDDAPRGAEHIYTGDQRTQRFIEVLKQHNIQTVFFVNTEKLEKANGRKRIESYANAGHLIGNHTHSYLNPRKTAIADYVRNIDQADELLAPFSTFRKWFRYPFLNEGDSIEYRDGVRRHLKERGYTNAYVTVDNYDFFINDLVQEALENGEKVNLDRACQMLVDLLWDGIQFYDSVAQKHIGSVRHTLLMHENDLEALCLDKLIAHIRNHNWRVVSPIRAFEDPLLTHEPDTLYLGQGRVAGIAHARTGVKYGSKWENEASLRNEFKRRKIIEHRGQ